MVLDNKKHLQPNPPKKEIHMLCILKILHVSYALNSTDQEQASASRELI